jgi:prepilin-type N-terminal cleavage/methylation domain-containing protein
VSRRGFTLLEVLAAVAVLALAYSVLAGTAMQGLANEGEAHRRLRASLRADLEISAIEAGLAAASPPLGANEVEEEDYTVAVEVRPFDLGAFALAGPAPQAGAERGAARPDEAAPQASPETGGVQASGPPFQLLTAAPGAPPPLLEIVVSVRGMEGSFEQAVTRTTFSADPATVQQAVASLPGAGGETAENAAADAAAQDPDQLGPEPSEAEGELER